MKRNIANQCKRVGLTVDVDKMDYLEHNYSRSLLFSQVNFR